MPSYKKGDRVTVTSYGDEADSEFIGLTGPITNIHTLSDGEVNYLIDIGIPGLLFNDLICLEGEFEHAKEENNE